MSVSQNFLTALICTLSIGLAACVTGPKRENDTAVDYLNGNNYRAGSANSGISPIVVRQAPTRAIHGTLLLESAPLHLPLGNQSLVLTRGAVEVTRSMTDFNGAFTLTGDIQNGTYTISLISDKYTLSHELIVSDYKTEGLQLFAIRKARQFPGTTPSQSRP